MGLGDWIMATSQVKRMHEANGVPVLVMGLGRRISWSEVFENNPRIIRSPSPSRRHQILVNGPNARPYIALKSPERWVWQKWDIQPGEIWLTDAEKTFAQRYAGAVLIEPHTKVENGNKSWPWERWQALVNELHLVRFVQVGPPRTRALAGVEFVETTFRQAAAVLSVCSACVVTEGALHHAAAALGVPAVVLWSEFISPKITGYGSQRNIRHAGVACGARVECASCRASMDAIHVGEVIQNLREVLL